MGFAATRTPFIHGCKVPGVLNNQTDWAGLVQNFDPKNPLQWEEWVGDDGKRTDTITQGELLGTLQGFVMNPDLLTAALVYFLGVSWCDYTNPDFPVLKRVLPAPHPQIMNSFARRVEIRGWKYKDKVPAPVQPPPAGPGQRLPYARYNRYFLTVDFGSVDYDVLPDGTIDPTTGLPLSEWRRFVSVDPEDDSEIVIVSGGCYEYTNPGAAGFPAGTPAVIQGPRFQRVVERTGLTIRAHNLPYDLLFDPFNIPRKLMRAKGKVNGDGDGVFFGQNDQTMLLMGFKPRKFPASVPNQTWTVMQFGVDVDFRFSYQEPVKGVPSETLAGWNIVPGLSTRWDAGYYSVRTPVVPPATVGDPIYSMCNMSSLLTHWKINDLNVRTP